MSAEWHAWGFRAFYQKGTAIGSSGLILEIPTTAWHLFPAQVNVIADAGEHVSARIYSGHVLPGIPDRRNARAQELIKVSEGDAGR